MLSGKLSICEEWPELLYRGFQHRLDGVQGARLGCRPASATSVCAMLALLCHQHSTKPLTYCESGNSFVLLVSVTAPGIFFLKPILLNRVLKSIYL